MANAGHIIMSGGRSSTGKRPTPRDGKEWLRQRLEDRPLAAAMQRVGLMTREEKARAGIDGMTKAHLESQRRVGLDPSETKIRAEVQQVADRVEAKKDIKG